ncbi:MAG: glycosyltransferase [Deltaproteobacteria bacterium]|nr:glycosyltransferase [Deltaproteobacteria bacterium]
MLTGTSLLPAYGGPAYSVSRLATALTDIGVEVGLWAPDQSALLAPLLPGDLRVRRLSGSEADALDDFGGADVLHDNGIWLSHNHRLAELAVTRGIPRVVSPRGMLEPWAMNHRRWKKYLAWQLYQRCDLRRAACHHATAETEAEHIRQFGLDVSICVIPNGVDVPGPRASPGVKGDQKVALYLGRIHPKKGLPMLIEAWARVRPTGWRLKIVGPDEAGHRTEVEKAVVTAGLGGTISVSGPVDGDVKRSVFFDADLFILPTHSENFGIVVAEAFAHGLPVLTTTGAPWSMLPERGCGWWVDATIDGIVEGLRQATAQDSETLAAMGARGRQWVAAEFGWTGMARKFAMAYERILSHAKC